MSGDSNQNPELCFSLCRSRADETGDKLGRGFPLVRSETILSIYRGCGGCERVGAIKTTRVIGNDKTFT